MTGAPWSCSCEEHGTSWCGGSVFGTYNSQVCFSIQQFPKPSKMVLESTPVSFFVYKWFGQLLRTDIRTELYRTPDWPWILAPLHNTFQRTVNTHSPSYFPKGNIPKDVLSSASRCASVNPWTERWEVKEQEKTKRSWKNDVNIKWCGMSEWDYVTLCNLFFHLWIPAHLINEK